MNNAVIIDALSRAFGRIGRWTTPTYNFITDPLRYFREVRAPWSIPETLANYAGGMPELLFPTHELNALRVAATLCAPSSPQEPPRIVRDANFDEAVRTIWLRARTDQFAIMLDFAEAYRAGLWLITAHENTLHLLSLPTLLFEERRLHHPRRPAISWPDGPAFHFWRGVQIDKRVIINPDSITSEWLLDIDNVETRRATMEALGAERILAILEPQEMHRDDTGVLYRIRVADDREPYLAVFFTDASTGRKFLLRVPPTMRQAKEAKEWTFPVHETLARAGFVFPERGWSRYIKEET